MPQNPNRLPTSSPESLGPEAATSSSYSLDSDDRFTGKLDANALDTKALFNADLRKQEEAKRLAQMEEAQLAQLAQDDLEAYLNQRPDEYGKDPNGNLLPSEEDLYNQTLNEARREREATSLTDLATAAGEALARGDKTMADDLQDEILQGIADRAETHNWDQSTIDRRLSDLTRVMNDTEAARLKEQQTTAPAAPPHAPESAPTAQSEPTQTVPTAPVKPVQPRSPLQTPPKPTQDVYDVLESLKDSQPAPELPEGGEPGLGEDGAGPDLEAHEAKQDLYERKLNDYTNESQKILDEREKVIRSLPDDLKEQADEDFDGLAIWLEEMRTTCTQLVWIEEVLANSATSAEERQALLGEEEKLIAKIGEMENDKPEIKTTGRPVSGEDGNDDEVLDVTRLLAAEEYKKHVDSANWYRDAYRASSRDTASLEKQAQLLMVSNWYNEYGIIYAKLRDTQLALAKPSISSNARQALISKEGTLISALKDLENIKPSSDLAVYNNNGETNSESEQNKDGAEEQPESKNNKADKENGEKWRRFKKFGKWFIRISGISELTLSTDTASKSSDVTGNTVDEEQRDKVKVSRKPSPSPIQRRRVSRKSSTNATTN